MRVIQDHQGHAAIELDPESRLLLRLGDENSLVLQEHPKTWFENVEQMGRVEYQYAKFWHPLNLASGEPYPPCEAIRKMMRGAVSEPTLFGPGVLEAVMENLPHGEHALFTAEHGFMGRYCCPEDAQMIARAHRVKPILFLNLDEFSRLPVDQQTLVALAVGATVPKKFTRKSLKEIFDMTSKAARKKASKAARVTGTGKQKSGPSNRADGPVAKARAIFEKMRDASSADIFMVTTNIGINKGTASVQLGKWRKEQGIVVTRGPKKEAKKKAAPAPNPAPKRAAAKRSRKKTSTPANGNGSPAGQSETQAMDETPAENAGSSDQPTAQP